MEDLISTFEKEDFSAKIGQPYYYNSNGSLKMGWARVIKSVDYGKYGEHKQAGFLLHFTGDDSPKFMVYNDAEGKVPKKGDSLVWDFNDHYSVQFDYPTYTVRLQKKKTIIEKLTGIFRNSS